LKITIGGELIMRIGLIISADLNINNSIDNMIMEIDGKSVIEHTIENAKRIKGIDTIVIATSNNPDDKVINDIALQNYAYYYNGNPKDYVGHLVNISKLYDLDYFIYIDGTQLTFDINQVNMIISMIKKKSYDYIYVDGNTICGIKKDIINALYGLRNEMDITYWQYILKTSTVTNKKCIPDGDDTIKQQSSNIEPEYVVKKYLDDDIKRYKSRLEKILNGD
jgi:spore coat polysaccharide biosynthesis protein SpsF (cytidylyltransferase family)